MPPILRALRSAAMVVLISLAVGCGSSQRAVSGGAGSTPAEASRGSAEITIRWPEQPSPGVSRAARMLPYLAKCVVVWFVDSQQVEYPNPRRVIAKATPQTTALIELPVGSYVMYAEARANANGTGELLASNNVHVSISPGPTSTPVPLTLNSAVVDLRVSGTDDVAFGQAAQFTATPVDANGAAVLVPVQDKASMVVTGDALYVPKTKQGGVSSYVARAIGSRRGSGNLSVTLTEGVETVDGQSRPKVTTADVDITVKGWQPPLLDPGEKPAGPRRVGYDPLYAVGRGWQSGDGTAPPEQKPSPLQSWGTLQKLQQGAATTTWCGWQSSSVKTSQGESCDVEASARYLACNAEGKSTMSKTIDTESQEFKLEYTIFKNFGDWWIPRDGVVLEDDACEKLYNDPEAFKAYYGDQVVIGTQYAHMVRVTVSFSSFSTQVNEEKGLSLDVSGSWGTGSADFSGKMSSFMKSQAKHKGCNCSVYTTIGNIPGLVASTFRVETDADVDRLFAALDTANTMVSNSQIDSGPDGAKEIGYTVAPISYLVSAVPTQRTELGSRLDEYMRAWASQKRALQRLDKWLNGGPTGPGGHFYWAEKSDGGEIWQRLIAARSTIAENLGTVIEPGIKVMVGNPSAGLLPGEAAALTAAQAAPFTNWPKPRVEAPWAQWAPFIENEPRHFYARDYVRVYDAPGLNAPGGSDVPFWVQTQTGNGWTSPGSLGNPGQHPHAWRQLADGTWEFYLGLEVYPRDSWGNHTEAVYGFSRDTVEQIAVTGVIQRSQVSVLRDWPW